MGLASTASSAAGPADWREVALPRKLQVVILSTVYAVPLGIWAAR
jgi:hypothetical protein